MGYEPCGTYSLLRNDEVIDGLNGLDERGVDIGWAGKCADGAADGSDGIRVAAELLGESDVWHEAKTCAVEERPDAGDSVDGFH